MGSLKRGTIVTIVKQSQKVAPEPKGNGRPYYWYQVEYMQGKKDAGLGLWRVYCHLLGWCRQTFL